MRFHTKIETMRGQYGAIAHPVSFNCVLEHMFSFSEFRIQAISA